MQRRLRTAVCGLSAGVLLMAVGCPSAVPTHTNSNSDSGSIITLGTKLAADNIGALNSAEWQILTNDLPGIMQTVAGADVPIPSDAQLPTLTDEQAEAIENFLADNNVSTFDDLNLLVQEAEAGNVEVPEELQQLWDQIAGWYD